MVRHFGADCYHTKGRCSLCRRKTGNTACDVWKVRMCSGERLHMQHLRSFDPPMRKDCCHLDAQPTMKRHREGFSLTQLARPTCGLSLALNRHRFTQLTRPTCDLPLALNGRPSLQPAPPPRWCATDPFFRSFFFFLFLSFFFFLPFSPDLSLDAEPQLRLQSEMGAQRGPVSSPRRPRD